VLGDAQRVRPRRVDHEDAGLGGCLQVDGLDAHAVLRQHPEPRLGCLDDRARELLEGGQDRPVHAGQERAQLVGGEDALGLHHDVHHRLEDGRANSQKGHIEPGK